MTDSTSGRSCGSCTACCKTHAVLEIDKPEDAWCEHCKIGVGCGRYETRPHDCAIFSCAWLIGEGRDDERPDKSKVVCGVSPMPEIGDSFTVHEMRAGAVEKSELARTWQRKGMAMNLPVWVRRTNGRDRLLIPSHTTMTYFLRKALKDTGVEMRRYEVLK